LKALRTARIEPYLLSLRPYLFAIIVAFGVIGVLIALLGHNPLDAFYTIIFVPLGSAYGLAETFKKFVPLLLAAFAYAIPFKARLFNIGGWGQLLAGGMVAAVVGLALADSHLPSPVFILLLLLVGLLAGALWAAAPAAMAAYFAVNPIISTIMMNFIAVYLVNYVATTEPWKAPLTGHAMTLPIPEEGWLPPLVLGVHTGIIVAIIAIAVVYFLMNKSVTGYEIKATGANPIAARAFGINVKRAILLSLVFGGAMAGIGGAIEVMGVHHRLVEGFELTGGAHYGVLGILTALICAGEPVGVPIAAFFMSVLLIGADALQRTMGVPVEIVFVIQVLIVLFVVLARKVKLG